MLLIHLAGHSGAGKTPLIERLPGRGLDIPRAPLYTSRRPRPGEVHGRDRYFLTRGAIDALPRDQFVVRPSGSMLQAVDLADLEEELRASGTVLLELYYTMGFEVRDRLRQRLGDELRAVSVFLTAIDPAEVRARAEGEREDYIRCCIGRNLERRGLDRLEKIETRAERAVDELLTASGLKGECPFDRVILSSPEGPRGEDDWSRDGEPTGRAASALEEFVDYVRGLLEATQEA